MQQLSYRILDARSHYPSGTGVTVDMSSSGILFAADPALPMSKRIELSIQWPAQLDGHCGLKLVATGRIVRVQHGRVAVRLETHEFRTRVLARSAAAAD
jgi:hypothetical protein